jgi:hypothetical protein
MSPKRIAVAAAAVGLLATAGAALLTGTAQAATPGPATSTTAARVTQHVSDFPLFDPHGRVFRVHFRTYYDQCVYFANHDRSPVPTVGTAGGAATGTTHGSTGTDLPQPAAGAGRVHDWLHPDEDSGLDQGHDQGHGSGMSH